MAKQKNKNKGKKKQQTAKPARYPSGKINYQQTRAIAKAMQNYSETKLKAMNQQTAVVPSPVALLPTVGPCYFTNYVLGDAPASWTGPSGSLAFNSLGGFLWTQGSTSENRVGRYMYLKRSTVKLQIKMNPETRHGECKFRVIVYKSKRNTPLGTAGGNPNDNLFLDHSGTAVGINTVSTVQDRPMDFSTWLVNKRNYAVVMDKQFILSAQQNSAQGSTNPFNINQVKPSEYNKTLSLGHYQKSDFSVNNQPADSNYQYCITILSMPTSVSTLAHNGWASYVRGTVSCTDS